MIKAKWLIRLLFVSLLLVGCAKAPPSDHIVTYYPYDSGAQNARTKLTEAAVSVSSSLNQLAAIEKTTHPRAKTNDNPFACAGLGGLASVDWTGPIEPLVLRLAESANYKFRVIGNRPAIPVFVQIYTVNMPTADILRDANFQAGRKADIQVYSSRRTIELRYRDL